MSIIGRTAARLVPGRGRIAIHDIQAAPFDWISAPGGAIVATKVDHAVRLGRHVLVSGWSSAPSSIRLAASGQALDALAFEVRRADVSKYLGHAGESLGWTLMVEDAPAGKICLECIDAAGSPVASFALRLSTGRLSRDARAMLFPALEALRQRNGDDVTVLRELDPGEAPERPGGTAGGATGVIDDARVTASGHGIARGWLVRRPETDAWIEDAGGRRFLLADAHWTHRADVASTIAADLVPFADNAGFMVALQGAVPGSQLRLVVRDGDHDAVLSTTECESWSGDAVAASRWLFRYPTPLQQFSERVRRIDLPILEAMMDEQRAAWPGLPVRTGQVGARPEAPVASIIVPLYGTADFVEHQLIEFSRDPWLQENAEIIYVIDDRRLLDRFIADAHVLQRLYGVAMRWVWGSVNRGFSGANNLGAAQARGAFLIFLNSDAFPRGAGWAEALVATLRDDATLGALGPRLLLASGGIQHAGMRFERREDLGIWVNEHPGMGLEPEFDPHHGLSEVPAVTGACLALRREHFDLVGGWDTGYLIGDFEDSDLCLKLRAAGLRIAYLPAVELTHLERQSFKLLGDGDYRTQVTIFNAVRHESRWRELIEASAAAEAIP